MAVCNKKKIIFFLVLVETLTSFATQLSFSNLFVDELGGDEDGAGRVEFVPSVRDVGDDIKTNAISESEGAHRVASAELHGNVDVFNGSDTTLNETEGLVHVRDEKAVNDETLGILAEDGDLADALCEVEEVISDLLGGVSALDDFNELHHGDGAEEVEAGEVRLAGRDDGGLVVD